MGTVRDLARVQSTFHFLPHAMKHISRYPLRSFSFLASKWFRSRIFPALTQFFIQPQKRCQIRALRWPQKGTTPVNPSSMRCCAMNCHVFRNAAVRRKIMFGTVSVEEYEYKCTTFSGMPFIYMSLTNFCLYFTVTVYSICSNKSVASPAVSDVVTASALQRYYILFLTYCSM
jgi:hypothetical protein